MGDTRYGSDANKEKLSGKVELIKLLLQRGAQLDAVDQKDCNAADYAVAGNKPKNLEYLRSLGLEENEACEF